MPAPNEMVWYKWFPVKALTSLRWRSLTAAQEGYYRRLYDWASLAQPSDRRGYLYEHNVPASVAQVTQAARFRSTSATQKFLDLMLAKGLMDCDENGAWGFPNFGKHQRQSPLRQRGDGLGTAEAGQNRDKVGTKSGQNRRKNGTLEAEAEAEAEVQTPPTPSNEGAVTVPSSVPIPASIEKRANALAVNPMRVAERWGMKNGPGIINAVLTEMECRPGKLGNGTAYFEKGCQRMTRDGVPEPNMDGPDVDYGAMLDKARKARAEREAQEAADDRRP